MCHQTVSLVARELESLGVTTVVMGSALDIAQYCGTPRFLFSDFPLGNPVGKPYDRVMQRSILRQGLELLEAADEAGTVWQTPFEWSRDQSWRARYARVDERSRARLQALGDERRARQAAAREQG